MRRRFATSPNCDSQHNQREDVKCAVMPAESASFPCRLCGNSGLTLYYTQVCGARRPERRSRRAQPRQGRDVAVRRNASAASHAIPRHWVRIGAPPPPRQTVGFNRQGPRALGRDGRPGSPQHRGRRRRRRLHAARSDGRALRPHHAAPRSRAPARFPKLKRLATRLGLYKRKFAADFVAGHCNEFCKTSFAYLAEQTGFAIVRWETTKPAC